MSLASEETITIAGIPTRIQFLGTGPLVLVLHGGPGFDHAYLSEPLRSLADRRRLIFCDQPGTDGTATPDGASAALIFRHCAALVDDVLESGRLGLIAHSWGCLVALGAATAGMRRQTFDEGLLITPVPTSRAGYDAARQNLFARMPADVVERYGALAAFGAHKEIVSLLLPYYCAKPVHPDVIGLRIDIGTFLAVSGSLGDFDFSARVEILGRCNALTAGRDFITDALITDLLSAVAGTQTIPDAGHFPWHEAPEAFEAVLQRVFPPKHG